MASNPGVRIRLNERCVWPERVGCEGVVVAPPSDGTYPQPAKWEVLVLLDRDPLFDPGFHPGRHWSCVVDRKSVEVI
jgi:hypothetical protein